MVTGAASGIGRAIASASRRTAWTCSRWTAILRVGPASATPPISPRARATAAREEAVARPGRFDVIVANAGVQHVAPISSSPRMSGRR